MPGLVPGIHVFAALKRSKTWMAGTSPAMTIYSGRYPLRSPSAARFHCATLSAIMRVDFIAAWLSWA
jgi:hypothetical protein